MTETCLHVAIAVPTRHGYDYLPPVQAELPPPGVRVLVPFGRQTRVGVVLGSHDCDVPPGQLKRVRRVLDEVPVVEAEVLALIRWAARYYQHPIGQVVEAALPRRLRMVRAADLTGVTVWRATEAGLAEDLADHRRAPVRQSVLEALQHSGGCTAQQLQVVQAHYPAPLKTLIDRGLVEAEFRLPPLPEARVPREVVHNLQQQAAIASLQAQLGSFHCTLLHGVTGSGKTEVYRAVIRRVLAAGGQVLVLVPEIGLVPQLQKRLAADHNTRIASYHSACTEREQYLTWLQSAGDHLDILIGTRSATFLPFHNLQLVIVDEEHDSSLKQQDKFHYHARDVAIYRARDAGVPVILGTATPSIETWNNVQIGKYQYLSLPQRAGSASLPDTKIIDLNDHEVADGLSAPLMNAIRETLDRDEQVLLFLNRRGFAPVLYRPDTEEPVVCRNCLVPLTYHRTRNLLLCHHCGARQSASEAMEQGAVLLGEGTQRIEDRLHTEFPGTAILRLDRDQVSSRGTLEDKLTRIERGDYQIVIGTQMLCKGHDFPNVTLVGIINIDGQLFSPRLRTPEQLAQVLVQVSGRAGRHIKSGRVLLQTRLPQHPMLHQLLQDSYEHWLDTLIEQRRKLDLPPFGNWALLQAQHKDYRKAEKFLRGVREQLQSESVDVLGPAPAMMPKRAGYWRAQLLLKASSWKALDRSLQGWLADRSGRRRPHMNWTLDVDPLDIA